MNQLVKDESQAHGIIIALLVTGFAVMSAVTNFKGFISLGGPVFGAGYAIAATQFLPEPLRKWLTKAWWMAACLGSVLFFASPVFTDPGVPGLMGLLRSELIFSFLPVYFALEAFGITGRDQNIYLYRAVCVGIFAIAAVHLSVATALYFVGGGIAAFAGDALVRCWVEGPAWFIDENGERQRIKGRNRGHFIYDPTTRVQRVVAEYQIRKARRRGMLVWSIMLLPLLYAINWSYHLSDTTGRWLPMIFFGVLALAPVVGLLDCLIRELIYQTGYQGMEGAKVLDPLPRQPSGLEDVERQKVHGDARVASEQDALKQLREAG